MSLRLNRFSPRHDNMATKRKRQIQDENWEMQHHFQQDKVMKELKRRKTDGGTVGMRHAVRITLLLTRKRREISLTDSNWHKWLDGRELFSEIFIHRSRKESSLESRSGQDLDL